MLTIMPSGPSSQVSMAPTRAVRPKFAAKAGFEILPPPFPIIYGRIGRVYQDIIRLGRESDGRAAELTAADYRREGRLVDMERIDANHNIRRVPDARWVEFHLDYADATRYGLKASQKIQLSPAEYERVQRLEVRRASLPLEVKERWGLGKLLGDYKINLAPERN